MKFVEPGPEWDVALRAAHLAVDLNERRGQPSPDWMLAMVEEGRRREHERAAAGAGQTG